MLRIEDPRTLTIEGITDPSFDPNLKIWASELAKLERYQGLDMIHRPNLLVHSMRVKFLCQRLGISLDNLEMKGIYVDFDAHRLVTLADQHDVVELVTEDLPAPTKRALSPQEKLAWHKKERRGAINICKKYFNPQGMRDIERYLIFLSETQDKQTIESQIVNVADKWDALGEKMHEVFCGNIDFASLVEFSRQVFRDFRYYSFWDHIENLPEFGFNKIPTLDELLSLPQINQDTLRDIPGWEVEGHISNSHEIAKWPSSYRTWLETSFICFWKNPGEFIFPGWYPGLKEKLGLAG